MADYNILLGAGPEKAVASTKPILPTSVILMLAYSLLVKRKNKRHSFENGRRSREISFRSTINEVKKIAKVLSKKKNVYTIGRGVSYPSALEAALKLKKFLYSHRRVGGGELKHGTIALIGKGLPALCLLRRMKLANQ